MFPTRLQLLYRLNRYAYARYLVAAGLVHPDGALRAGLGRPIRVGGSSWRWLHVTDTLETLRKMCSPHRSERLPTATEHEAFVVAEQAMRRRLYARHGG